MGLLLDSAKFKLQQRTHRISLVPIVVLYLNNVCDSRCGTCSIWKNNDALKAYGERQMTDALLDELYERIRSWHLRQILLSGGEPALHPRFPEIVRRFASFPAKVCVVTNGLLLNTLNGSDLQPVSEFYISFDAPDRETYQEIRGVDGFERLRRSISLLRSLVPHPKIVARCTLQRANVARLTALTEAAREIGFDTISFLGVDVRSSAFSRDLHGIPDSSSVQPRPEDLIQMRANIEELSHLPDSFIEGGTARLEHIFRYFRALLGELEFPVVHCNAPWVSTVIETTGKIRGCFFQPVIGDFRNINGETAIQFRRTLNVQKDATCQSCVCSKLLGTRDFARM